MLRDNPGGVLNYQDEMAGWFASFDCYRNGAHGKDQSFWLQTDDGGAYNRDRAAAGGSFHVPNASCCFIGGIQPDKLRPLVKTLASDGFLQRTFPIYGRESAVGELYQDENSPAKEAYERLIEAVARLDPASAAQPIIYDWEADIVRRRIEAVAVALARLPTTPAHLQQHLRKWRGKVTQMVLLFHVIECVSRGKAPGEIVPIETVERVEAFMLRFVLPNAVRFYSEFFRGASVADDDAHWFAGYILAHKGGTGHLPRSLPAAHNRLNPKTEGYRIMEAMAVLGNASWVGEAITDPRTQSTSWTVNPKVHVRFAALAAVEKARREAERRKIEEAAATVKKAGYD